MFLILWAFLFYFNLQFTVGIDLKVIDPIRLLSHSELSCFFTLSTSSNEENRKIIKYLADVSYGQEMSVGFGLIDLTTFQWPNGENVSFLKQNKNESNESNENIFILFIKSKTDRTCLLQPANVKKKNPKVKDYEGKISVENIIQFLNSHCNLYRNPDGSLTIEGMHRDYILQNLFHVKNVSSLNMAKIHKIQMNHSCTNSEIKEQLFPSHICKSKESEKSNTKKVFEGNSPIPQCEKIILPSKSDFFHDYLSLSKPVIIQNATSNWLAFKKWTNKYLRKTFGERTVHIKLTPGGEYEGVEMASLWDNFKTFKIPPEVFKQLQFPDLVVVRPAAHNMKFSEFMDIVESVSSGKLTNVSAYLEYTSVDQYMPELKEDIEEMPFFKDVFQLKHLNLWLSDGNTLGKTHFDPFDNFLCQISGQKQVIMYSPHDAPQLYEGHIPEAMLSVERQNFTFRRKQLMDSTSMVMSPVDILSPDIQKFPLFADAYPINCTISEGEVLFMPAFWWHEVQSRPNVAEGRNLAVNFWYEPFLTKEFPCAECKLDVNPKYRHLL